MHLLIVRKNGRTFALTQYIYKFALLLFSYRAINMKIKKLMAPSTNVYIRKQQIIYSTYQCLHFLHSVDHIVIYILRN